MAAFDLGLHGPVRVRDLWAGADLGTTAARLAAMLPPHGAGLYHLEPA